MSHSFSFKNIPPFLSSTFFLESFPQQTHQPNYQSIVFKRNQPIPFHFGSRPRRWRPRHPFVTEPPRPTLTPCPTPPKKKRKNWGQTQTFWDKNVLGCLFCLDFFLKGWWVLAVCFRLIWGGGFDNMFLMNLHLYGCRGKLPGNMAA